MGCFPGGANGKESSCQSRRHKDVGSIPGLGTFPGGGHDNPLQYSCLENPMDRGAWRATIHRVAKSQDMIERVNNNQCQGQTLHQQKNYNLLKAQMIASIFFFSDMEFLN